jgi:hypothetical protein
MYCRERSVGIVAVLVCFLFTSSIMAPRGSKDITIQNSQVREVHAIDTHWYLKYYDINE